MLDSLFTSVAAQTLTLSRLLLTMGTALALGLGISLFYQKNHKGEHSTANFAVTLIMLPTIISVIIMLIGTNVASAFSLAGAFSLIRFRSEAGDPKDISYVFFSLGVGLACGIGYLAYAAVFAVLMCAVMAVLHRSGYARPAFTGMQLKITVPEDQNFGGLFDSVLDQYTLSWHLKRIKTSDFGTLFELTYLVNMRPDADPKRMIDELRCRNGNLNISLVLQEYEEKGLAGAR